MPCVPGVLSPLPPTRHTPSLPCAEEEGRGVGGGEAWESWIRMVHALTAAPTAPARVETGRGSQ